MHANIIPVEFPQPLSRDVFKTMLTSAPNKLAQRALETIRSPQGTVADLKRVCGSGRFYDAVVARAARHPRSRAIRIYLLDEAYDQGEIPTTIEQDGDRRVMTIGEKPPAPDWPRRVNLFAWMAAQGFRGGSNGWRGDLLNAVMNGSCYHPEDPIAFAYANALVETGRVNVATWAARNYQWVGSVAKLAVMERLGLALDAPGLLDNAVRFLGCSPNSGETKEGRGEVLDRLLKDGARINREALNRFLQSPDSTSRCGRDYAAQRGFIGRLAAAVAEEDPVLR